MNSIAFYSLSDVNRRSDPVKNFVPSGSLALTIIFCAATKATLQSGSMCCGIRCALDSFAAPKNGRMRVRSRESIERNEWL